MNHIENKIAGEALAKLGIANLRPQQKAPMEAIFRRYCPYAHFGRQIFAVPAAGGDG